MTPLPTSQQGTSLIEMMIASLVGLILLAGTMQMFSTTKQSSRTSTAIARMQENGRAGLYFLENAVHLAGYRPDSLVDFQTAFPGNANFDFSGQIIQGIDNDNNVDADNTLRDKNNNGVLDGTDSIQLRYLGNNTDKLVFDCGGKPVTQSNPPARESAFRVETVLDPNGKIINAALVCDPDLGTANDEQILIDGVENLQIRYGIDTNSDFSPDFYSDEVPNGAEVVTTRIALLLRSDQLIATQPQTYRFDLDGSGVRKARTPDDRRLRKVFTSTIAVRNLMN